MIFRSAVTAPTGNSAPSASDEIAVPPSTTRWPSVNPGHQLRDSALSSIPRLLTPRTGCHRSSQVANSSARAAVKALAETAPRVARGLARFGANLAISRKPGPLRGDLRPFFSAAASPRTAQAAKSPAPIAPVPTAAVPARVLTSFLPDPARLTPTYSWSPRRPVATDAPGTSSSAGSHVDRGDLANR